MNVATVAGVGDRPIPATPVIGEPCENNGASAIVAVAESVIEPGELPAISATVIVTG